MEEEGSIGKFKDYTASAPAESKPSTKPTSPSKASDSTVSTTKPAHSNDQIFSSPAARKLAEDNNVSYLATKL